MTTPSRPRPRPRPTGRDASGPDDDRDAIAGLIGTRITTPAQAGTALQVLVGPEAAGPPALWCVFLDPDDRLLPLLLTVDEQPDADLDSFAAWLAAELARLLDDNAPGGSVVVALVGDRDEDVCHELEWAYAMGRAAEHAGVPLDTVLTVGPHGPSVITPRR